MNLGRVFFLKLPGQPLPAGQTRLASNHTPTRGPLFRVRVPHTNSESGLDCQQANLETIVYICRLRDPSQPDTIPRPGTIVCRMSGTLG